ncbi:MAG: hypothetical protein JWP89_4477 [Schlesneria sp.]|nr:hypothetical protein [Schlesneria sp.]
MKKVLQLAPLREFFMGIADRTYALRKIIMDSPLRFCVLIVMLIGIISLAIWWVMLTWRFFFPPEPDTIAPFNLVGLTSPDSARPLAMARLLSARLMHLNSEIEHVKDAVANISSDYKFPIWNDSSTLRPVTKQLTPDIPTAAPPPPSREAMKNVAAIFKPMEPIDVDLKIGGVELNWLVAWVQSYLSKPNSIEVTVHYQDADAALVAATFGQSSDTVWRQLQKVEGKDIQERIVSEVAYAYWYQKMSVSGKEQKDKLLEKVKALPVSRFQSLIETLSEFASLQTFGTAGRRVPAEWAQVSKNLAKFIEEVPEWDELLPVAEQAAHRAMDYQEQLRLARIERTLLDLKAPSSPRLISLKNEIQELEKLLKDPVVVALTDSFPTVLEREILEGTLNLPVNWMDPSAPADAQHPASGTSLGGVVSIVGCQPFPGILASNVSLVGEAGVWTNDYEGRLYSGGLGSVVQYVAPQTPLRIIKITGLPTAESLVTALKRVGEPRGTQILLYAYGPSSKPEENDSIFAELLKLADQGTICVISAGDGSEDSAALLRNAEILKKCVVIAAVDEDGLSIPKCEHLLAESLILWSFGSKVPVRVPTGTGTDNWGGTGPAAAIAAGCILKLASDCPTASSAQIIGTLRTTARSIGDGNGPPVLQFESARKKLDPPTKK